MKIWGNVLSHQNSRPKKPPSPILEIKTWKERWAPAEATTHLPEVTIVFLLIKQTEGNLPKRSMRWQKEIWFRKWWMFYSEFNFFNQSSSISGSSSIIFLPWAYSYPVSFNLWIKAYFFVLRSSSYSIESVEWTLFEGLGVQILASSSSIFFSCSFMISVF